MKKLVVFTLIIALLTSCLSMVAFAEGSPADYGWKTDNDDFTGWEVIDENGIRGVKANVNSERVWKELTNLKDFTVSVNVQPEQGARGWIRAFGIELEINAENGNGNQVFLKHNGNGDWQDLDWFDCTERFISVVIKREAGGKLQYAIYGKDNATPKTFELDAREENPGIEFKLGGNMEFTALTMDCAAAGLADLGWNTDNDNDFTGWEAVGDNGITGDRNNTSSDRVWKNLTNLKDFKITADVVVGENHRGWISTMGIMLELNAQGGNGNQAIVKHNGDNGNWVDLGWQNCTGRELSITIERVDGGKLVYTIVGKDNATPVTFELDVAEEKADVEFKIDKVMEFRNVILECAPSDVPDPERPKTPLEELGWTGESNDWTGWGIEGNVISGGCYALSKISQDLITNIDTFKITADFDLEPESSVFFNALGIDLELDARHGNGNQFFVKGLGGGDWMDAQGCAGSIVIERTEGGDIQYTVYAAGNDTPMTGTRSIQKKSNTLTLGFYAGSGTISNLAVECAEGGDNPDVPGVPVDPTDSPFAADGWWTDDIGEDGNFLGWEFVDGKTNTIHGLWMDMENTMITKEMLPDPLNFSVQFILRTDWFSSPAIVVCGKDLEMDGNHGDGNQVYLKEDTLGIDWFTCQGDVVYVNIVRRDGGDLEITLYGEGNPIPAKLTWKVKNDSPNITLKVHRGEATFENLTIGAPDAPLLMPDLSGVEYPTPTDPTPGTTGAANPTTKPAGSGNTQQPSESSPAIWIVVAVVAVLAVAAVVVVVLKKRK